jgi:hypothetical protein
MSIMTEDGRWTLPKEEEEEFSLLTSGFEICNAQD